MAPTELGWFLTDAEVITLALQLLRLVAWTMVLRGMAMVLMGVMRASGTVWVPTGLGVLGIVCIELPVAWLLNAQMGMVGIWWAYVITFVTLLGVHASYYWLVWRRRPVRRLI